MKIVDLNDVCVQFVGKTLTLPSVPAAYISLEEQSTDHPLPAAHLQANTNQPFAATKVLEGFIYSTKSIVEPEHVKRVYDVTLKFFDDAIHRHSPGDTIGILPHNLPADVECIVDRLNAKTTADKVYVVGIDKSTTKKRAKVPDFVPSVISLRRLFSECLELRAVPKKSLIRALVPCTTESSERRFLEVLCSKEGDFFYGSCVLNGRGFISLLKQVPSCQPTAAMLIEHLPRLMPRPYSIANAYREDSNTTLRFIFSTNPSRPGVTTTYLSRLESNEQVNFYFRQTSAFTYKDDDLQNSILMVGSGTGVSPFLSFLDQRAQAAARRQTIGKAELIAGFSCREWSFQCKNEIMEYIKEGVLDGFYDSYSKDENPYFRQIQNRLKERKVQLVEHLRNPDSLIYVCGDPKVLLPQVTHTIVEILTEELEGTETEDNKAFIEQLKKDGKYREDVWL